MTSHETAAERQAHILGMIDQLTVDIGAYLTPFANDKQAAALPLAMMRMQGKMRSTWLEFVADAYDTNTELWVML